MLGARIHGAELGAKICGIEVGAKICGVETCYLDAMIPGADPQGPKMSLSLSGGQT